MRLGLQVSFWVIGVLLQIFVISGLLRGYYKRFPFVFVYAITVFLATVAEASMFTRLQVAREVARNVRLYYWIGDAVLKVLLFCVVISLIDQTLTCRPSRPGLRKWLLAGAAVVFVTSFVAHAGPVTRINQWMTLVSRDLSFTAAILDLLLWFLLIASKRKDYQLLMLSGGLGIQFAGDALGQSIRHLAMEVLGRSRPVALAGGILVAVANLLCFYIWWQAFRPAQKSGSRGAQDPL